MSRMIIAAAAATLALAFPASADEPVVCTLALEAGTTGALIREGNCDERMSPASTFKVAISLMGFDSGILTAPYAPEWPFQDGYADWNPKWKQATTPKSWMQDSVVWFSQRSTEQLGPDRFAAYVDDFDYGNEDVSGDKGFASARGRSSDGLSGPRYLHPVRRNPRALQPYGVRGPRFAGLSCSLRYRQQLTRLIQKIDHSMPEASHQSSTRSDAKSIRFMSQVDAKKLKGMRIRNKHASKSGAIMDLRMGAIFSSTVEHFGNVKTGAFSNLRAQRRILPRGPVRQY